MTVAGRTFGRLVAAPKAPATTSAPAGGAHSGVWPAAVGSVAGVLWLAWVVGVLWLVGALLLGSLAVVSDWMEALMLATAALA